MVLSGATLGYEDNMRRLVAKGAKLRCADGSSPCALSVTRTNYVVDGAAIANVEDHLFPMNIEGFGMCSSLQNPLVQTATAAANGTLTPVPCVPPAFTPWTPGATFIQQDVGGGRMVRALTNDSRCNCGFGPTVTVEDPATDLAVEG